MYPTNLLLAVQCGFSEHSFALGLIGGCFFKALGPTCTVLALCHTITCLVVPEKPELFVSQKNNRII
jgi:hypothetical protein